MNSEGIRKISSSKIGKMYNSTKLIYSKTVKGDI